MCDQNIEDKSSDSIPITISSIITALLTAILTAMVTLYGINKSNKTSIENTLKSNQALLKSVESSNTIILKKQKQAFDNAIQEIDKKYEYEISFIKEKFQKEFVFSMTYIFGVLESSENALFDIEESFNRIKNVFAIRNIHNEQNYYSILSVDRLELWRNEALATINGIDKKDILQILKFYDINTNSDIIEFFNKLDMVKNLLKNTSFYSLGIQRVRDNFKMERNFVFGEDNVRYEMFLINEKMYTIMYALDKAHINYCEAHLSLIKFLEGKIIFGSDITFSKDEINRQTSYVNNLKENLSFFNKKNQYFSDELFNSLDSNKTGIKQ